jgi:hypothetical protein
MMSITYKPFMLSVIMPNAIMLSVIVLNAIMLSGIILNVAAPWLKPYGTPPLVLPQG